MSGARTGPDDTHGYDWSRRKWRKGRRLPAMNGSEGRGRDFPWQRTNAYKDRPDEHDSAMKKHPLTTGRISTGSTASNGDGPAWLDALRRSGRARFDSVGPHHSRRMAAATAPRSPHAVQTRRGAGSRECRRRSAARFGFGEGAACELVLRHGHFSLHFQAPQLPRGVRRQLPRRCRRRATSAHSAGTRTSKPTLRALNTGLSATALRPRSPEARCWSGRSTCCSLDAVEGADRLPPARDGGAGRRARRRSSRATSGRGLGRGPRRAAGVYFTNAVTEIVAGATRSRHYKLRRRTATHPRRPMQVRGARAGGSSPTARPSVEPRKRPT